MARITARFIVSCTLILCIYIFLKIADSNSNLKADNVGKRDEGDILQTTVNKANGVFEPDKVHEDSGRRKKLVILLAYLRGGSSFLGRIFNMNQEVFYWYEPLADVYNSFSMAKLMTLSLQVLYTRDGLPRSLTEIEKDYIHDHIFKMFTCDYMKLPVESLASWTSMESPGMRNYRQCFQDLLVKKFKVSSNFKLTSPCEQLCQRKWHGVCTPYIGESMTKNCHVFMNRTRAFLFNDKDSKVLEGPVGTLVHEYTRCLQPVTRAAFKCLHLLDDYCSKSRIKATKIARMRLADLQIFLESKAFKDQFDIYVIHLLRDPRGIIASRKKDHRLTKADVAEEAGLLCHKMLEDIKARENLSSIFNETFLQVKYEELADEPIKLSRSIYEHIKENEPPEVTKWLADNTNSKHDGGAFSETRKNSSATARAWKKRLSDDEKLKITYPCSELLEKAGYQV